MTDPRLHPEVQSVLAAIEAEGGPALETLSPHDARKLAIEGLKPYAPAPVELTAVENREIPGPLGPIPIRIYTPDADPDRPALVYFHGGGWVLCDLDTHDAECRAIARRAGAVVIAVDYRLAPEHKFPAAIEDSFAATQWVASNAQSLGVDPTRISVGGDSAGGNLAAVISLRARDESGPALAGQILVYPVTNLAAFDTPSYREFAEGYYLTLAEMEWFRDSYLRTPADGSDPHASPLLAPDLAGLPPALVITAECDVLRDEGEAYAKRLEHAGVAVTVTRHAGMIHPFFSLSGAIAQGTVAIEQVADAVRTFGLPSGVHSPLTL